MVITLALLLAPIVAPPSHDYFTSFEDKDQTGFNIIVSTYPPSVRASRGDIGDPGNADLVRTGSHSFTTQVYNLTRVWFSPPARSIDFWARDETAAVKSRFLFWSGDQKLAEVPGGGTAWTHIVHQQADAIITRVDLLTDGQRLAIDDLTYSGDDLPPEVGAKYCGPAEKNLVYLPGEIYAYGSDVAGQDDLTLLAADLPAYMHAYFLVAAAPDSITTPFGAKLCLRAPVHRLLDTLTVADNGGLASSKLDLGNTPKGHVVTAGETWYFQCWYRDHHPGLSSNFTDAVEVTFR